MKKRDVKINKLIFVFVLFAVSVVAMMDFFLWTEKVRYFNNYDSAMAANEKIGFAVPYILPKSATDIRLKYGLESYFVSAEFSYDLRDQQSMTEHFDKITASNDTQAAFDRIRQVPWVHQIPHEKVEIFGSNYPAGIQQGQYALLVLKPDGGRAWYFSE